MVELLKEQGADDVVVTVGGTIPADDIPELKKLGRRRGLHARAPTRTRSSTSSAAPSRLGPSRVTSRPALAPDGCLLLFAAAAFVFHQLPALARASRPAT